MRSEHVHQFRLGPNVVAQAVAAVRAFGEAEETACAPDVIAILVEELMFNLLDHGGAPPGDPVELRLSRSSAGVRLVLVSGGTPFDPRDAARDQAVPERGGGAGLALLRAWAQIRSSERIGDRNRLELLIPAA